MPGTHGIEGYLRLLAAMPGTSAQLAKRCGMTRGGVGKVMRKLWTLGLCYPGGWEKCTNHHMMPVWHFGQGECVAGVKPAQPGPNHAAFKALWEQMLDGATVADMAEASGLCYQTTYKVAQAARRLGLCRISTWTRLDPFHPVPVFKLGKGESARRPPPQTEAEKWRRYAGRRGMLRAARVLMTGASCTA